MNTENKDFQNLIKNDRYQVFVFSCRVNIPFIFARHPWFVLNKKGEISRWEVRDFKNKNNSHIFFNNQPPFEGINMTFFPKGHFWRAKLIGSIEGNEDSIVPKIIDFIKNSEKNYPYRNKYVLTSGPNSNTYAQWVLNKFPEFNIKLSWRFFGKNFKMKK